MVPVLSEGYTSSSSSLTSSPASTFSRRLSRSSSIQSLADVLIATSALCLAVPGQDGSGEETLTHVMTKLDARQYKKLGFASQVLKILRKLNVPAWFSTRISPEDITIYKVSGALTNAVFFVSSKNVPSAQTLLLRVYGPSSGTLISRTRELHTLHTISSRYNIGPRIYGTFENGRIEEYFDSLALTASSIRDPQISRWIAVRMAELHSVDIAIMDDIAGNTHEDTHGFEIISNIKLWLSHAEDVLKLPGISDSLRHEFDLPRFKEEWQKYLAWTLGKHPTFGRRRVFAHNDAQYGNLLRLKDGSEGVDGHRQIVVVDFEYAAGNPAAYDIANHFHEWTANYHGPSPHILTPSWYPSKAERRNFYVPYIQHAAMLAEDPCLDDTGLAKLIEELDKEVEIWGVASHAGWAIWGIIQSREDVEANVDHPEFNYIGYATGRMAAFREDIRKLGIAL